MSEQYMREILRVSVAQICQTIGYVGTQVTPLELLQDILHKFFIEFSRDLRRQTEHYNRNEANLTDTMLTLSSLNIDIKELINYINNVESVPCVFDVPKIPVKKESNLNFLKPGSKEVLVRPVHIYEYLPPIYPPEPNEPVTSDFLINEAVEEKPLANLLTGDVESISGEFPVINESENIKSKLSTDDNKKLITQQIEQGTTESVSTTIKQSTYNCVLPFLKNNGGLDAEGRPTREISSVVMTTGGFISPAIQGKLADAIIPDIVGNKNCRV